jgi:hypothetical protein
VTIQLVSERLFVPSAKRPDGSISIAMSTIVVQIPKREIVNLLWLIAGGLNASFGSDTVIKPD